MVDFAKNLPIRRNMMSGMDRISDMPRVHLVNTNTNTITTGTPTSIIFDNTPAAIDTDGMWSQNLLTRTTVRTAGLYDIKAQVLWAGGAGGAFRNAWIIKNGVTTFQYGEDIRFANANIQACNISTSLTLNANDYLELRVFQDSGGNLATSTNGGTNYSSELIACLVST